MKIVLCKFCGQPVNRYTLPTGCKSVKHFHDECLIENCIKAIKKKKTCKNDATLKLADNYGYTKAEILEVAEYMKGR